MNLAVIPARGGSKRIPRKNVKPFAGRPMIAWSIDAAKACGLFDHIVVSTDDRDIADVAIQEGAEVPFLRPRELSDDHTPTIPVVRHAIDEATSLWGQPEHVCCLYATAPFVTPDSLREGHRMLADNPETDFAFSATTFPFPIFRALKLNHDGTTGMFWPEHELTRSQDLPEAYHDAGQFYWGTTDAWNSSDRIFTARSKIVLLPRARVQDIDTPEDWTRAEAMFRARPSKT